MLEGPDGSASAGERELLRMLLDGRPRTRSEISAETGLARATVASRVDALMRAGLIGSVGDAVSTGGRPPSQFALNPASRVALAADLGATHATVALVDLTGAVLARRSERRDIGEGPEAILGSVVDSGRALLADLGRPDSDLVGVGIGVPGPVQFETGQPVNPPIMPGWHRFDIPGWMAEHLAVPVLVDNDVNIMALGERSVGWPDVDHLIFLKVATGVGSGIISGGVLQRGAQGIAGDLGHVQIARGAGIACHCGNRGCLEAIASGPAIARALREEGVDVASGQDVVDLVQHGDIAAIQAVRQAGRDIGEVLATCVSLVNPSVIAVGGSMARVGEHLIAGIREVVYTRSMPLATEHLRIATSVAGPDSAVIGAGILALDHALSV